MIGERQKTILVTGIGGNVGQGILRILRNSFPQFHLVGTDINNITAGHYFSDFFHKTPYSDNPDFPLVIQDICTKEHVDLIIPSTLK